MFRDCCSATITFGLGHLAYCVQFFVDSNLMLSTYSGGGTELNWARHSCGPRHFIQGKNLDRRGVTEFGESYVRNLDMFVRSKANLKLEKRP